MANLISSLRPWSFASLLAVGVLSCGAEVEPPPSGVAGFTRHLSNEAVVFVQMRSGQIYRASSEGGLESLPIQRAQAVNDLWFVNEVGMLFVSPDASPATPYTSFVQAALDTPVAYVGGPFFRDRFGQAWSIDPMKIPMLAPVADLRDITVCDWTACIMNGKVVYLGAGDGRSLSRNRVDWHHGAAKEIVPGYALRADGFYEFESQVLTEDGILWTVASDGNVARVEGVPPGDHMTSSVLFGRDGSAWSWGIGRSRLVQPYGKAKTESSCSFGPGPKGSNEVPCAAPERLPSLDGLNVLVTSRFIFTIDRNGVAGCIGHLPYDGDVPVCPPLP